MRCGIYRAYKPPKSHHCKYLFSILIINRVCNRCIIKMDHHCPWINNCVGMMNMKFFLLLLLYSFIFCLCILILSVFYLIEWSSMNYSITSRFYLSFFLFLEIVYFAIDLVAITFSLFFCIFSICLLVDFINTVLSGNTST